MCWIKWWTTQHSRTEQRCLESKSARSSHVVSKNSTAQSTVAATMRIASMAGIKIFVTGGIGGVHRGAETTLIFPWPHRDVTNKCCCYQRGIKSILDITLTLETMETLGIPVVTFRKRWIPQVLFANKRTQNSRWGWIPQKKLQHYWIAKWAMGINGSVLVANPIPEDKEVPHKLMEKYIHQALILADQKGIHRKRNHPIPAKIYRWCDRWWESRSQYWIGKNNARLGAKNCLRSLMV